MATRHALFILFYEALNQRHSLMMRALKEEGWEVSVIAWSRQGPSTPSKPEPETFDRWLPIKIRTSGSKWEMGLNLPFLLYKIQRARKRLPAPDLTIFTHLALLPLAWDWPGKKIFDACEFFILNWSKVIVKPFRKILQSIFQFLERLLLKNVHGVLTVDSHKEWMKKLYQTQGPTQVIWNLPSTQSQPDADELDRCRTLYEGKEILAFVGGLRAEKGLFQAIEAAALVCSQLPSAQLILIGPMMENMEAMKIRIQEMNLEEKVLMIGSLSYSKLLAHLHYAKIGLALHQNCGIYPWVSSGNGRKFFTYMQAQLAIVGPDFGEVGRAIDLAQCGVRVDTSNPATIAEAVIRLLNHPEEMKTLGENGQAAFLKQYNWEQEKPHFLQFIENIMQL